MLKYLFANYTIKPNWATFFVNVYLYLSECIVSLDKVSRSAPLIADKNIMCLISLSESRCLIYLGAGILA